MHLSDLPNNAKLNQVVQLAQTGRLREASALCQQILQSSPNHAHAWHLLGLTTMQQGQLQQALSYLQKALTLDPDQAEFHNHAGVVHFSLGNLEQGITSLQQALALQPHSGECRYNLALGLQKLGRLDQAKKEYEQLIVQQPNSVSALVQLGIIAQQQQQYEQAIALNRQAVALAPQNPQAWCNLAVALQEVGEVTQAQTAYQKALTINPGYAEACNGLGALLEKQGQASRAIAAYQQALSLKPDFISALLNLGNVHCRLKQWQEAETAYRQALNLDAHHPQALDGLLKVQLPCCEWQELETLSRQLWQTAQTQPGQVSPLHTLYLPFSAAQQQTLAQHHAEAIAKKMANRKAKLNFTFLKSNTLTEVDFLRAVGENKRTKGESKQSRQKRKNKKKSPKVGGFRGLDRLQKLESSKPKIRLGYVSGDFRNHAVAQLMLRLFELHGRQGFEVYAYSLGPDDSSEYRQKLMADCDCFRDLRHLTPSQSAQQIYDDGINILIDLAGYTEYAAPEIFALRPAPLQVNYLGYPGTLGADYIDYIITDPVITPASQAKFLTEQCLYLPDCYQINNNQQFLPDQIPTKSALGLPQEAVVFCCFNKSEKIEPNIFGAWMRILAQVDNSVLWLLESNPRAQHHLTAAAESLGIGPERLIFAPRLPKAEHLSRHAVADLFLDTYYYNAHTTGSDSLWVGVPLITVLGETFASRVAASLLTAVELPQLIAENLEAYEALAVHLATHPQELAAIKQHLQSQRQELPLFNTPRTVGHLEAGYRQIWERYLSGAAPQPPSPPAPKNGGVRMPSSPNIPPMLGVKGAGDLGDERFRELYSSPKPEDLQHSQTPITCNADAGFQAWLAQSGGSLAITTYQAGNVSLVGWNGQQVTLLMRQFTKPMGMAWSGDRLALATKHEVVLLANAQNLAYHYLLDQPGRYDALYLPRASYFTGDLNVHDLAFGKEGLWLVNTRFSCLASLSAEFSFVPRWQPPFISQLAPEDRCHLNGLAMVAGQPKYVTALGESDRVGGWRENKADGGILIDVDSGEILLRGLSMPHSPRWHQGALWLLNSGKGELCRFDPHTGEFQVICTLPGFGRGLCLRGDYALVGLCQIRETNIFGGLPIQEQFEQLICGVAVVDCRSGAQVGLFEFTSGVQELYEVQFLPQKSRPTMLNSEMDAVRDAFTAPEFAYWLRPECLTVISDQLKVNS